MFGDRFTPGNESGGARALLVLMLLIALAATLGSPALAGSGSSRGGVTAGPTGPAASDPFLLTHVVKVAVVAVDLKSGRFTVRDLKTEQLHELAFHPQLSMRAKNKKSFGGRRNLIASDIAAGQLLKLTVRDADGAILRLRVEDTKET